MNAAPSKFDAEGKKAASAPSPNGGFKFCSLGFAAKSKVLPMLNLNQQRLRGRRGMTLIELLCVMVIICILASLLLPVAAHVYRRAKAMSEEFEEDGIAQRLRHEVRNYCAGHPQYQFDTKTDLDTKCILDPKTSGWINASHTEFVSFNCLDSTNKIVVSFHYGKNYAQTDSFTKGELTEAR